MVLLVLSFPPRFLGLSFGVTALARPFSWLGLRGVFDHFALEIGSRAQVVVSATGEVRVLVARPTVKE